MQEGYQVLVFLTRFGLMKCVRTLVIAIPIMAAAWILCRVNAKRSPLIALTVLLILPVCSLFGYSKLFYTRPCYVIAVWLDGHITQWLAFLYGSGVVLMLARYAWKCHRQHKHLRTLPDMDIAMPNVTARGTCSCRYADRIAVRVTEEHISPYSTGIVRPVIVLPKCMVAQWSREQLNVVIEHEKIHLLHGHIVILTVFVWLKIIWWWCPLIYVCERALREQLEYVCDCACVDALAIPRHTYAELMLKAVQCINQAMRHAEVVASVSFAGRQYAVLKNRLLKLGEKGIVDGLNMRAQKRYMAVMALVVLASVAGIVSSSYPRWTKIQEVSVYDSDLQTIAYDAQAEGLQVRVDGRDIAVDQDSFNQFCKAHQVTDKYVYISYGGMYKIPGVGGGGEVVQMATDNVADKTFLSGDYWYSRWNQWIIKYAL
jgi:beta-lactamase regulating signal transducer with metallopeptidase domain